jgi:hypothetical protein
MGAITEWLLLGMATSAKREVLLGFDDISIAINEINYAIDSD